MIISSEESEIERLTLFIINLNLNVAQRNKEEEELAVLAACSKSALQTTGSLKHDVVKLKAAGVEQQRLQHEAQKSSQTWQDEFQQIKTSKKNIYCRSYPTLKKCSLFNLKAGVNFSLCSY